eukprot:CAMPEP_0195524134 /NCGR_PEP_ID=MMETSP0794_2-20130614/23812_1 /TAXON_ID=515487 /ORGANISM="Stephanopyxis turris, Strain CCMP 815" /LENGTH=207 /DNA_ID=CAMNT_0040654297 /DNA_START=56 /DNA_END=679 /DNA_ORIENTATION=+
MINTKMYRNFVLAMAFVMANEVNVHKVEGFMLNPERLRIHGVVQNWKTTTTTVSMGFFDNLKVIFSEEGKKNIAAYNERQRQEQEAAQREIRERRNNPERMAEYDAEIANRRRKLSEDRDVYKFQNKVEEGYDPLTDWERLRAEGKIVIGDDLERDKGSERLGSAGLQEVRVDERMPYIDQGYVDDDADVMGNFMNIFGGKKKDKKE